jgi:hypothetical protein
VSYGVPKPSLTDPHELASWVNQMVSYGVPTSSSRTPTSRFAGR